PPPRSAAHPRHQPRQRQRRAKSAARSASPAARPSVFDKGYVHYKWWTAIHRAGSFFVTRPKGNMGLRVVKARDLEMVRGDGFTVLADEEVALASKGDSKLPIPLRRVRNPTRQRKDALAPHQRHDALGRRNRRSLQGSLADRAFVPL